MAESVTIRAFVRAPYDAYVNEETRFWNASGLAVKLGAEGVKVEMESLRALLFGGVAFDTPAVETQTAAVADNHLFPLFADRDAANSASYTRTVSGVSYFTGEVRGLAAGSEVSMHGIKIGEVKEVRLVANPTKGGIVAMVRYQVQPERIVGPGTRFFKTDDEAVTAMLNLGLRANLESANLLTGQQTVALEIVHDATPAAISKDGEDFVIPSVESGGFAGLTSSATDVLNKINTIPFTNIGTSLDAILGSLNKATDGPQLKAAVNNLATALATAQKTLVTFDKLAVSVDSGYGNDTKFYRDLDRLLVQTNEAVNSIRAVTDMMSRHPEALIKGRSQ